MTNTLWQLPKLTEADEFKVVFEIPDTPFEEWVYNWLVPVAEQYGFEFTDEQRQDLIDDNFGSGDRVADIDESQYYAYFAEELFWLAIDYLEEEVLNKFLPKFQLIPIYDKIILVSYKNATSMSREEIKDRAW